MLYDADGKPIVKPSTPAEMDNYLARMLQILAGAARVPSDREALPIPYEVFMHLVRHYHGTMLALDTGTMSSEAVAEKWPEEALVAVIGGCPRAKDLVGFAGRARTLLLDAKELAIDYDVPGLVSDIDAMNLDLEPTRQAGLFLREGDVEVEKKEGRLVPGTFFPDNGGERPTLRLIEDVPDKDEDEPPGGAE